MTVEMGDADVVQTVPAFMPEREKERKSVDQVSREHGFPDVPPEEQRRNFDEATREVRVTGDMKFHKLANIFPLLEGMELTALAADIMVHGLREPIRLFEDKILDGRNRYRACQQLGIEPKCLDLPADLNLWDYVWSANAERRHLAPGTRAVVFEFYTAASTAWEAEKRQAQEETNRKRSEAAATRERTMGGTFVTSRASNEAPLADKPEPKKQKSRDNKTSTKKAKAAGVSEKTAERAHAVVENRPDLALKVKAGDISLNDATRSFSTPLASIL
jgi:hypothetical protein